MKSKIVLLLLLLFITVSCGVKGELFLEDEQIEKITADN